MRSRTLHRRLSIAIGFACTATALAVATIGAPAGAGSNSGHGGDDDRRHGNDLRSSCSSPTDCARISSSGSAAEPQRAAATCRRWPSLLGSGSSASGGGLLTQAPPNTGAGWYSLATGAWPGVTGSTNNTFHINGQPFANRTSAFDAGVLQAESIAQSAERGGKKVIQFEFAGGRGASTQGPTVDFRSFFSGRGVATNYIAPTDDPAFTTSFGLQFDHPAGFAGQAPYPQAAPTDATGWTNVPQTLQPREGDASPRARLRRRQVRPRRLHLRQPRRRPHQVQQGALLTDEGRQPGRRHAPRRAVGRRQGADRRRDLGGSDRGLPHQGRDARQGPLAGPVVPHVGGPRARLVADVARRSGLHRGLRRVRRPDGSRAPPRRTSRSSRRGSSARRPTSSRVCTGRRSRHRSSAT